MQHKSIGNHNHKLKPFIKMTLVGTRAKKTKGVMTNKKIVSYWKVG